MDGWMMVVNKRHFRVLLWSKERASERERESSILRIQLFLSCFTKFSANKQIELEILFPSL